MTEDLSKKKILCEPRKKEGKNNIYQFKRASVGVDTGVINLFLTVGEPSS